MTKFSAESFNPQSQQLQALSASNMRMIDQFNDPDINIADIEASLKQDPGLVAQVLRVANSPFFGLAREIASIREALVILGISTVRNMVAASVVMEQFPKTGLGRFDPQRFWAHSMAVARGASVLANKINANSDEAFICGLLHDIGRLVLASNFQESYNAVMEYRDTHGVDSLTAERAVLESDHAIIGEALADSWNFPPIVQRSIRYHHEPDLGGDLRAVTATVCLSDLMLKAIDRGVGLDGIDASQLAKGISMTSLRADDLIELMPDFQEYLSEAKAFVA